MPGQNGQHQTSFQERLERLGTQAAPEPRVTRSRRKARPHHTEKQPIPKSFFLAIVLGGALVLAGNVIWFANSGLALGYFAQVAKAIGPLPITGLLLFVLMIGFGFRDKPHVAGLALGMPGMYFGEPYLAYLLPDVWVQMYSAMHVDAMLIQAGLRLPPGLPPL